MNVWMFENLSVQSLIWPNLVNAGNYYSRHKRWTSLEVHISGCDNLGFECRILVGDGSFENNGLVYFFLLEYTCIGFFGTFGVSLFSGVFLSWPKTWISN